MGVLYEHWRLDTNQCFYIGQAMGIDPYGRAHDLSPRNKHHGRIIKKLKHSGLIEVRTAEFFGITQKEMDNIEILAIAHWKYYVGNILTNIAKGGHANSLEYKSEQEKIKLRAKSSEVQKIAQNRKDVKDKKSRIGYIVQNDPVVNAKRSGEHHWTADVRRQDRIARGEAHPFFGKPAHNKGKPQPQTAGELNPMNDPGVRAKQKNNVPRGEMHYTRQLKFEHFSKKDGFVHWFDSLSLEEQKKYREHTKEQFSGDKNPSRKMSKEALIARALKGHETRRRNKEMKLAAAQAAKIMEN